MHALEAHGDRGAAHDPSDVGSSAILQAGPTTRRRTLEVLLLSAYDADSHARLRRGLVAALPEVRFTTVTLPPRHYAWRAAGNALALAEAIPRRRYDVLLAMGPVDLASLRGLRPDLVDALTVLYLHEHEFAYPTNPRERGRVDRQMRQILALLAADRIRVNSRWCAESLLDGVRELLARLPDAVPADTVRRIEHRLAVEPVPLEDELWEQERPAPACSGDRLEIVWNHRHEWDKGPDRLPVILRALHGSGLAFRLHLLGQRFRARPAVFAEIDGFLAEHPGHRGECTHIADRERYRARLLRCDVVLSTALQEFQGLAVMEACALGCLPCVPDRLAYRDWVPENLRAPSVSEDAQRDGEALAEQLLGIAGDGGRGFDSLCGALAPLAWSSRVERWRALLAASPGTAPDQG